MSSSGSNLNEIKKFNTNRVSLDKSINGPGLNILAITTETASNGNSHRKKDEPGKDGEWFTYINGHKFNEDELMEFFNQVDGNTRFNMKEALRFFIYHMIYNLGLAPIAMMLIFVLEGFNIKVLFNLEFLPMSMGFMH